MYNLYDLNDNFSSILYNNLKLSGKYNIATLTNKKNIKM